MNCRNKRSMNFTLLELLVVIAIITILASMLLPALRQARIRTTTIACASNLRQLNFLVSNYESDHNDICIPYILGTDGTNRLWARLMTFGDYWSGYYDVNHLYPKGVICPAETGTRNGYTSPHIAYTQTWDYGMNNISSGPHPSYTISGGVITGSIVKKMKITRPTQLMNLMDLNLAAETDWNYSSFLTKGTSRHGSMGAGNVIFIDGHLEFMKRIPFQRYSGENIWNSANDHYPYWYK